MGGGGGASAALTQLVVVDMAPFLSHPRSVLRGEAGQPSTKLEGMWKCFWKYNGMEKNKLTRTLAQNRDGVGRNSCISHLK